MNTQLGSANETRTHRGETERRPGAPIQHAPGDLRKLAPCGGLLVSLLVWAPTTLVVQATAGEAALGQKGSQPNIASNAIAFIEVPQPERLIDRVTDPRFQEYLKLVPQYQKLLKDKKFEELRSRHPDRRAARHDLGARASRPDRRRHPGCDRG